MSGVTTVLNKIKTLCEGQSLTFTSKNDTIDDCFYCSQIGFEIMEEYVGNNRRRGTFEIIIWKVINLANKFSTELEASELAETIASQIYENYSTATTIESLQDISIETENDYKVIKINPTIEYEV